MAGGRLKTDSVYLALTRPAMVAGVTYTYCTLNGMICLSIFIYYNNPAIMIVMGPIVHGLGYYMCLREPRLLELFLLRCGKCMKCRNRTVRHFGNNSYDLY